MIQALTDNPEIMYIALIEKELEMSNAEALHQLFAQCQKVNFDESYDIIASAQSPEEADFFSYGYRSDSKAETKKSC